MITRAMIGLISTPVISLLPEASARDTSQPPPGPITNVFAPGRSRYGNPGPAYFRSNCCLGVRCSKSKRATPVDASASMKMFLTVPARVFLHGDP